MSTPNQTLYDGYDIRFPHQHGPIRSWVDSVTRSRKYARTMRVLAIFWQQIPFSATGPLGGFCIGQSSPHHIGAGMVEYEENYADMPLSRRVSESITFPLQFITASNDLVDIPLTTTANVVYEYFNDPTGIIAPLRSYRISKVGNDFWVTGVRPLDSAELIIAQDSKCRNWAGNITERATPYVRTRDLSNPS